LHNRVKGDLRRLCDVEFNVYALLSYYFHWNSVVCVYNFIGHRHEIHRGADKSLAFPVCNTTKRIFLGWVKEVRTTKSSVCGAQGEYVNTFFQSRSFWFSLQSQTYQPPCKLSCLLYKTGIAICVWYRWVAISMAAFLDFFQFSILN
jgi:hypothetical protein